MNWHEKFVWVFVASLVITFPEAIQMPRSSGVDIDEEEDLSTPNEKLLGRLVKAKVRWFIALKGLRSSNPNLL